MATYQPTWHICVGAAGLAVAVSMLLGLGALAAGRGSSAAARLIAGWGVACLGLTLWGVSSGTDLRFPLIALAIAAAGAWVRQWRDHRPGVGPREIGAFGKVLLLTFPLWLVMLPLRPSEIDTWWNLLPNVAYLFDHGRFPVEGGPESYSFLPVAPYNTQFVAFAASVFSGSLAEGALALFNLLLLCAAATLLAHAAAHSNIDDRHERRTPWWACGLGCLMVAPLNPGFDPRVSLSPYGETGLAVTTLFVVWFATGMLDDLARGVRPRGVVPLALALAALVNIKQSGIGLLLAFALTSLALCVAHPKLRGARAPGTVLGSLVPAFGLYAIWRLFVAHHYPAGELQVMPMAEWNWPLLPRILAAMLKTMVQKIALFVCPVVAAVLAIGRIRSGDWSRQTLLFAMTAGIFVLFVAFLVFSYVAHSDPASAAEAHSLFRYAQQLGLTFMLALTCILRPWVVAWLRRCAPQWRRRLEVAPVALVLALPFACVMLLRFDLAAPQPVVWDLARETAARLDAPNQAPQRIALLLPGDVDDGVGSMLRGVMLFVPPRLRQPDFLMRLRADPKALAAAAAQGYEYALISCTAADLQAVEGLAALPSGVAALLRRSRSAWDVVQTWHYAPDLAAHKFAGLIERAPLCAGPVRDVGPAISWHRPACSGDGGACE